MPDDAPAPAWQRRLAGAIVVAIAVGGTALLAYRFRHYMVDDAYIGFRYIDNLLHGRGLVFNPGERIEGVTNIGWLLALTPFAALLGAPLAAKLVGAFFLAATACLAGAIAWRLSDAGPRLPMAITAASLIMAQFDLTYFALAGMETGLIAFLLLSALWFGLDDRKPRLVAVIAAAAFAVRPEAVLVYPIALSVGILSRSIDMRALATRGAIFAGLCLTMTAARYFYFGDFVPNTFHAKLGGSGLFGLIVTSTPAPTNIPFPFGGLFAAAMLLAGAAAVWRRAAPAAAVAGAIVAAGYVFARYAPPDWTGTGRYFAPYVPAAAIVLLAGGAFIERRLRPDGGWPVMTLLLAGVIALSGVIATNAQSAPKKFAVYPGYVMTTQPLQEAARWIRDHTPADAVIATRRIGLVAYASGRRVWDYSLGLTDREITKLVLARGERFWSPADPELEAIWTARRPEYLLEDSDVIDKVIVETGGTPERFAIHGLTYHILASFPVGERRSEGLFGRETKPIRWTLAERLTNP
jgi:hypothetical protein